MKTNPGRTAQLAAFPLAIALVMASLTLFADQLQMQNGDRYVGTVLGLNTNEVIFQSEFLGKVTLPRGRVAVITLGSNPTPATKETTRAVPAIPATNNFAVAANPLSSPNPAALAQVRNQYLKDAGPEANQKFNELLGGLMSGKLSVADIRAEAKTVAEQVRALRQEAGEEAGPSLDGYLAILDKFVRESGGAPEPASTNRSGALAKPKNNPEED